MDHHCKKGNKKHKNKKIPFWMTTGMRQNYFAVITALKVPAPALMPRKCEDEETKSGRREREENEKRPKREKEREKLRTGGKERRARLAAGGSNCVINLKVRFSRERTGGEKGRGIEGEEEEREGARDIRISPVGLCRGVRVFFRGTVYTCETTARIRNCR